MWSGSYMSIGDSLILSGMGLLTVLSALSALAILIVLFSKVMEAAQKKPVPAAAAAAPAAPALDVPPETAAAIIAVVCEELKAAPEELIFTSIKKL